MKYYLVKLILTLPKSLSLNLNPDSWNICTTSTWNGQCTSRSVWGTTEIYSSLSYRSVCWDGAVGVLKKCFDSQSFVLFTNQKMHHTIVPGGVRPQLKKIGRQYFWVSLLRVRGIHRLHCTDSNQRPINRYGGKFENLPPLACRYFVLLSIISQQNCPPICVVCIAIAYTFTHLVVPQFFLSHVERKMSLDIPVMTMSTSQKHPNKCCRLDRSHHEGKEK